MLNIHAKPRTKEEVIELFEIIESQRAELLYQHIPKVTCAGCQRKIKVSEAYHCYHCELWLCPVCSMDHFGKRPIGALAQYFGVKES